MKILSNLIEVHIFKRTESGLKFLLLKRSQEQIYPGVWQMVSGKIKETKSGNEQAFETAIREVQEETALRPVQLWVAPTVNSFYDPGTETITLIPVFAARVDDNKVTISEEHSEFKWVGIEETKKLLAWQGQRNAAQLIEDYFLNDQDFLKFVEIQID